MSYCRFSVASDAYVIPTDTGFTCYCNVNDFDVFATPDAAAMLRHLKHHRDVDGLDVPDYAFAGIFTDRNLYRDHHGDYEAMYNQTHQVKAARS